ncbi:MAG: TRAM domain-containing protein, partial [Actinomycetota bacterium]|nr:TRAM domain-containing protein [Actinomycetota bacterium]
CDPEIVTQRYERLRAVILRSGLRKHENRIGKREDVIVEGPSKKDSNVTTGRTRQNKLVHFMSPKKLPIGSIALVEIVSASPHYLNGNFDEVIAMPARKPRIPVVAV